MNPDAGHPPPTVHPSPQRLSFVRWKMVGLLMALCFISHLNRVSMAVAADERIMKQLDLSPMQMGFVYSAFLLVYTLCMTPGGFFIDHYGPRLALMAMGFGSAFFGMCTGLVGFGWIAAAQIWISLIVVRSLMGFFTTPLHPASAQAVFFAVPESQRAWANGLITGAALVGIACTYPIFGALIDWVDWPAAFLITGTATALLSVSWSILVPPKFAEASPTAAAAAPSRSVTAHLPDRRRGWMNLLKDRSILLLTLSYAAVGYFQYLFFYWMHFYFENILHFGKQQSRFYSALPVLAMAVGMPLGGRLSDRLQSVYGPRLARAFIAAGGMILSSALLLAGIAKQHPEWVVLWFTISLGALGLTEGIFWTTATELGGTRGGTAAAILNTGGNGIGLLAPVITPAVSAHFGWQWGLGLGSLVCLLGALCWFGIQPRKL